MLPQAEMDRTLIKKFNLQKLEAPDSFDQEAKAYFEQYDIYEISLSDYSARIWFIDPDEFIISTSYKVFTLEKSYLLSITVEEFYHRIIEECNNGSMIHRMKRANRLLVLTIISNLFIPIAAGHGIAFLGVFQMAGMNELFQGNAAFTLLENYDHRLPTVAILANYKP